VKNDKKVLTSLPAFLCLLTTCLDEYLFPGGTDSLNVSSSGTLEGMILSIGWPVAGQSNQPGNNDNVKGDNANIKTLLSVAIRYSHSSVKNNKQDYKNKT
jgi:hypothetical protein